jgi:ABC-2 type transport system permease protein
MNWKRMAAVTEKETKEILRDRLFFVLAFLVPSALMLLFGYGLTFDVEHLPIANVDHDGTAMSRDYAHRFIDSRYFDFHGYSRDERQLDPLLTDNKLRAVIVIPEHFERDLTSGRPAHVQTLIDGTFPFRADTTKGYIVAINSAMSIDLLANALAQARGIPAEQVRETLQPVKLEVRYLYNESLRSIWSLAPELIMLILMVTPPFLTALGVVREKENGAIYNIYASTVTRAEFLIGKLTPYVAISMLNGVILWTLAAGLYGVPFRGNFFFFLFATFVYVNCTTGIGLLVSILVRTQVAAMIASVIVTFVPTVLYSGVLIPIPSLHANARVIAALLPAMYYNDLVVGCFLKGAGIGVLWPDVLALAVYAGVLLITGYVFFRKRPNV